MNAAHGKIMVSLKVFFPMWKFEKKSFTIYLILISLIYFRVSLRRRIYENNFGCFRFASLSLPVMSVAASVYEMPAVLVTAERTEAEIRKEPQSAEIVTSEDIKRSGAYDMRSALSSVLNLSVERSRPAKMREWAAIR